MKKEKTIDYGTLFICALCAIGIGLAVVAYPAQTVALTDYLFGLILEKATFLFVIFALVCLGFVLWLAFSKYGNIRLGAEKPEFKRFTIFVMIFCAAFGASAMFWCMTETLYYYANPPFGIEGYTLLAAEWSLPYNFLHYGPSQWAMYPLCTIPIIYTFYVKGNKSLKLSNVCETLYDGRVPGIASKLIDVIFILSCFGVCSMSLALSIPMISKCLAGAFGFEPTFALDIGVILVISIVFSFSSYIGLGKGMSTLSNINAWTFIVFLAFVLLLNGVVKTADIITNSVGILLNNYFRMSLNTDPYANGGFPQSWTAFYWAYCLNFAPAMSLFIARIMKGYRLRDMISLSLLFGPVGCFAMHGIMQTFAMSKQLSGAIPVAEMVTSGRGNDAIVMMLQSMPFGTMAIIAFTIVAILFMATTIDSNSFTLATMVSYKLDKDANPSPLLRLVWCLIITAIPLGLTVIAAPLDTIKTIALTLAVPLGILFVVLNHSTRLKIRIFHITY